MASLLSVDYQSVTKLSEKKIPGDSRCLQPYLPMVGRRHSTLASDVLTKYRAIRPIRCSFTLYSETVPNRVSHAMFSCNKKHH